MRTKMKHTHMHMDTFWYYAYMESHTQTKRQMLIYSHRSSSIHLKLSLRKIQSKVNRAYSLYFITLFFIFLKSEE